MKNVLLGFLFGFLILASACAPAEQAAEEATAEATEEEATTEEAEPTVVASTESYTTVVLEDGIASPRKEMKGAIGDAEITVGYGSPSVKGREIWGGLNPFDKLWRTGANGATTIEFSQDVTIEGQPLAAGKYSVFSIPTAESVTIIFNTDTDQRGTSSYDEAKDALRVTVAPQPQEASQEAMEFMIEGDQVVLSWDTWKVPFTVAAASTEG